jgi:hypothetical protein
LVRRVEVGVLWGRERRGEQRLARKHGRP